MLDWLKRRFLPTEAPRQAAATEAATCEAAPASVERTAQVAACKARGNAFLDNGRLDDAAVAYRQMIAIDPDRAEGHLNLGYVLREQKRYDGARHHLSEAARLEPTSPDAHYLLGTVLSAEGLLDEAICRFERSLALRPNFAEAHCDLGSALRAKHRLTAAEECHRRAIAIRPEFATAYSNLGLVLGEQGKLDDAIAANRRALSIEPGNAATFSNLLLALGTHPGCTPEQYAAEARQYGLHVMARARPYARWHTRPGVRATRPLRVGLVSGDLRTHPVGFFLENVCARLDSSRIALFAYATNAYEDDLTARMKPHFAGWTPIVSMSDEAAARRIHDDGIDVLVDLAGHTADNRLPVFAWKPAPVQVSWLGYFASTGVPGLDYLLADRMSVQGSRPEHFSEKIWHLPETRLCFTAPTAGLLIPPGPLPALSNGYVTFGCFQSLAKVQDAVLASWARIFAALPTARLRMQCRQLEDPVLRDDLLARLAHAGIAPARITLAGPESREDYLRAYAAVDILLDTFPYPGGTTTCEALWMGVPTLTLAGATLLARQGASMLACVGLGEWIAEDEGSYVRQAIARATDIGQLADLRSRLRGQVLASPLFDGDRFARHLEDALLGMWDQYEATSGSPA